jgi:antitoxin component YwqK of YwqJK toxin-antitoxin module
MRFYLLSVFCFFLCLPFLFSQEGDRGANYTDQEGKKQGYWEKRYPDGNIQYHGTFVDGRPSGKLVRYFPNGNIMAVMDFHPGGLKADSELYYEEGGLAATGTYVNEQKDSVWKYYSYYEKHLTSIETWNKGIRDGLFAVYYPNGQIAESFLYENGSRTGPWRQYYENGKIKVEAEFKDDQRHGEFIYYSPDGRPEISGQYLSNQMHGEWLFYDKAGKPVSQLTYNHGRPENEGDLIDREQELFRLIEEMRGKIPEPDESELFSPRRL